MKDTPMHTTDSRPLFGLAACFNFAVAIGLLGFHTEPAPLLLLDSASGSNALMRDLFAILVTTFGVAYLCVALQPQRFRAYIALGILGKLLVVAVAAWHVFENGLAWRLPALASGDLVFALLFWRYLHAHPLS